MTQHDATVTVSMPGSCASITSHPPNGQRASVRRMLPEAPICVRPDTSTPLHVALPWTMARSPSTSQRSTLTEYCWTVLDLCEEFECRVAQQRPDPPKFVRVTVMCAADEPDKIGL